MKKLISILATLAMVLSVTSSVIPTVFAEGETTYYLPTEVGVVGGALATAITKPVYGMVSVDGVKKYTPRNHESILTYHAGFIYKDATAFKETQAANYVVFETDFAGNTIQKISVCRRGSGDATAKLTSGWADNRWNTLRIVYETPTDEYEKGRAAFYINGQVVKNFTANTFEFDDQYRVSFLFNNNEGTLYVKNYRMYASDTNPGADGTAIDATLVKNGLTVSANRIIAPQNVAVNSLTASNDAAIRVYSNADYTTQLAGEDIISSGNIVVLEKDGKLDYYEVTGDLTTIIYDAKSQPEWTVNVFTAKDDVTAYGGKASGDTSKYYELPAESEAGSLQFFYPLSYHYRYVVAKYSFYFDNDEIITGTLVTTGGNNESSVVRNKNIKSGEWNNVIVWIDTQKSMSKVYLNGALLQDWTEKDKQFLSDDTDTKKYFRLRFEGTADGAVRTFAVDDFEMYTTTALPEIEKDYKSLSGSYITATGEAFYKSGATVDSILADTKYQADGATAVIYDTATGAAVTTGDLPATAKLALRTDDSTIKSYDLIAVDGIKAWDNGARSKNGFAFADSGVLIAARYVGGKFISVKLVSVENGMAKAQMNYTGEDGEKVKFMLWNSLSGMDPIYKAVVAQ